MRIKRSLYFFLIIVIIFQKKDIRLQLKSKFRLMCEGGVNKF